MGEVARQLLESIAYQLRVDVIRATTAAGSGHPTSCLSAADILAVLFFNIMQFNPEKPHQINNDRFVLSKGHAAPLLYAVYKQLGIVSDKQLLTLRQIDSVLEGHPTHRFYHTQAATGSLGCGLSIGLGIAFANRLNEQTCYTYVLLGDSECAEGSIWEAVEVAAHYKTNKLIAVVDANRLGQTGQTMDGHNTQKLAQKFEAFGWHVLQVDGHDISKLEKVFKLAQKNTEKPVVIIVKTFKGYGVDKVQDKLDFHGKAFKQEELQNVLEQLKKRFLAAAKFNGPGWEPNLPELNSEMPTCSDFILPIPEFPDLVAPRKAFGQALTVAGSVCNSVVCLDAEVKNSTFTEIFEEQHPFRFFQSFIAEQNMVGMATGFAARKKIPFVATFAAFLTRAFDQIRMAAIGKNPLRIAGTHVGVSIGQDGPSQMGLEDIAMMRTIPGSIILYPSDATSTFKLVELMANYDQGISYIRLTREVLPHLYTEKNRFEVGGCAVLQQPDNAQALIVAAGVTVHEALKAAEQLKQDGISVSVIDLYCIKPLNERVLLEVAHQSNNKIITVEDHYLEGGLGQAVASALVNSGIEIINLGVTQLPCSGKPEELRKWAGIDAAAIMSKVKN